MASLPHQAFLLLRQQIVDYYQFTTAGPVCKEAHKKWLSKIWCGQINFEDFSMLYVSVNFDVDCHRIKTINNLMFL